MMNKAAILLDAQQGAAYTLVAKEIVCASSQATL